MLHCQVHRGHDNKQAQKEENVGVEHCGWWRGGGAYSAGSEGAALGLILPLHHITHHQRPHLCPGGYILWLPFTLNSFLTFRQNFLLGIPPIQLFSCVILHNF